MKDAYSANLDRIQIVKWAEVKELKRQGHEHVMSDERILGDSAFVENLLSQADEAYERRYELKRLGYDAERIAKRVAEIYDMDPREFLSKGKQQLKVTARSFLLLGNEGVGHVAQRTGWAVGDKPSCRRVKILPAGLWAGLDHHIFDFGIRILD